MQLQGRIFDTDYGSNFGRRIDYTRGKIIIKIVLCLLAIVGSAVDFRTT